MASGDIRQLTRDLSESYIETTLPALLSNTLVLYDILPYLPVSAILNLASASRSIRALLHSTPSVLRHLDLTSVKAARLDPAGAHADVDADATEDDFYSAPVRGTLTHVRRRNLLQDVQTLVLDGLSVTAELCSTIMVDPAFRVRILSIREVKNLNEHKLQGYLRYACRQTRPEHSLALKALYVFGKKDAPTGELPPSATAATPANAPHGGVISSQWNQKSQHALQHAMATASQQQGEDWYGQQGRVIGKPISERWADTLVDCRDAINFDAVLCTGPRHLNSPAHSPAAVSQDGSSWAVATFALGGCASCGTAPEGLTTYGEAPSSQLPLLGPVPTHSSTVKAATCPRRSNSSARGGQPGFVPRCRDCIRERYCFSCNQWWCEACYQVPLHDVMLAAQHVHIVDDANGLADHEAGSESPKIKARKITRSCWECDLNCDDCIADTQKICRACGGGYCILHYEGSTHTLCDWCSRRRGRRCREMY